MPAQLLDGAKSLPSYSREGDAGIDLCSIDELTLKPFERALVSTGLKIAIPAGYAGLVMPRSGLALKHGLSIVNTPGLIDSNYRGELSVILINLDPQKSFCINRGDRIAQLVIIPVEQVKLVLSESLEETGRGEQGFGSSGIASS